MVHDVVRVIFIISAFVGGIFLLASLVGGAVTVFDSWRGRALRGVPVHTVDELLRGKARPRRVAVRATPVVGPGEEQRSPVSDSPCLWYRLTLHRVDRVTTDNGHDLREETVWSEDHGPTVWFDDGTGVVPVEVSLLESPLLDGKGGAVDRSVLFLDEVEVPTGRGLGPVLRRAMVPTSDTVRFELVEELVRLGVDLTLFGRPVTDDGQLVLAKAGGSLVGVTKLTPAEVLDHQSAEAREGWWTLRLLVVLGGVLYLCGMGGTLLLS